MHMNKFLALILLMNQFALMNGCSRLVDPETLKQMRGNLSRAQLNRLYRAKSARKISLECIHVPAIAAILVATNLEPRHTEGKELPPIEKLGMKKCAHSSGHATIKVFVADRQLEHEKNRKHQKQLSMHTKHPHVRSNMRHDKISYRRE